jgi:hypothetical protein
VRTSRAGQRALWLAALAGAWATLTVPPAAAWGTPPWIQTHLGVALAPQDEKTEAVQLYAENVFSVESDGRVRRTERRVYRILRAEGADYGTVTAASGPRSRVSDMHGWSFTKEGKTFEVKDGDAVTTGLDIEGAELVSDVRLKILKIPASVPGSTIAFEIQTEEQTQPFLPVEEWRFQELVPVREAHFTLQLPSGWQYRPTWLNYAELSAAELGGNRWQWSVSDVPAVRLEQLMPSWQSIAGRLLISMSPSGSGALGIHSWQDMGAWYLALTRGRRDPSPELKAKALELSAAATQSIDKVRALAAFVQNDIRYVAIELGVGGMQPHAAAEVFAHRYGDCKDKVTLLSAMLSQLGIDSAYVLVNTERGAVTADSPPQPDFDHMIIAVRLPADTGQAALPAETRSTQLGSVLLFDPTDQYTPFGRLSGTLQGGYGLVVSAAGGELLHLPQAPGGDSVRRSAHLTLDEGGTLRGEVRESLLGDRAAKARAALAASAQREHSRALESHLGSSFSDFRIVATRFTNTQASDQPLEWNYGLEVPRYAKLSGNLLLVRPRVLGSKASAALESRDPRQNPVEFAAALDDSDEFEILLPAGYALDDLPPAVDLDVGFASYHSKTELKDRTLHYQRSFRVNELLVPAGKAAQLRDFYRAIAADERAVAVLKRIGG